jgi:hypothetical protein
MHTRDVPNRLTPTKQTPVDRENSQAPRANDGATPADAAAVSSDAGWRARVAPIEPWLPLFLLCFAVWYYASYALSGVDLGGRAAQLPLLQNDC